MQYRFSIFRITALLMVGLLPLAAQAADKSVPGDHLPVPLEESALYAASGWGEASAQNPMPVLHQDQSVFVLPIDPRWTIGLNFNADRPVAKTGSWGETPAMTDVSPSPVFFPADDKDPALLSSIDLHLQYIPTPTTQLGLSLRSDPQPSLLPPPGPNAGLGGAVKNPSPAPSLTLNAVHRFNQQWATRAGVTWTKGGSGAWPETNQAPDIVVPLIRDDSWRYALGIIFYPSAHWSLQAGLSLDQYRWYEPGIEGGNPIDEKRVGISAGLNYNVEGIGTLNLAYARWLPGEQVTLNPSSPDAKGSAGGGDAAVDVVAARFKIQF